MLPLTPQARAQKSNSIAMCASILLVRESMVFLVLEANGAACVLQIGSIVAKMIATTVTQDLLAPILVSPQTENAKSNA